MLSLGLVHSLPHTYTPSIHFSLCTHAIPVLRFSLIHSCLTVNSHALCLSHTHTHSSHKHSLVLTRTHSLSHAYTFFHTHTHTVFHTHTPPHPVMCTLPHIYPHSSSYTLFLTHLSSLTHNLLNTHTIFISHALYPPSCSHICRHINTHAPHLPPAMLNNRVTCQVQSLFRTLRFL